MGWGNCGTDSNGRPIGYLHDATCDHPGCAAEIHRGLAYACGGMHGTGTCPDITGLESCEGYFCDKHLTMVTDPADEEHGDVCRMCMTCAAAVEAQGDEP